MAIRRTPFSIQEVDDVTGAVVREHATTLPDGTPNIAVAPLLAQAQPEATPGIASDATPLPAVGVDIDVPYPDEVARQKALEAARARTGRQPTKTAPPTSFESTVGTQPEAKEPPPRAQLPSMPSGSVSVQARGPVGGGGFAQQIRGVRQQEAAQADAMEQTATFKEQTADAMSRTRDAEDRIRTEIAAQRLAEQKMSRDFAERVAEHDDALQAPLVSPWASKSTGNKILSALMIGLGQFAAGMTGGPNQALNIINQALQRDMDLQLQNRAEAKGARQRELTAWDRARALSGERIAAKENEILSGWQQLQKEMEEFIARHEASLVPAQINEMRGMVTEKIGQLRSARDAAISAAINANSKDEFNKWMKILSEKRAQAKEEREIGGLQIPLFGDFQAKRKTEAEKVSVQLGAAERILKTTAKSRILRENFGKELKTGQASQDIIARMDSFKTAVLIAVKDMEQLGAITKSDADIIQGISADNVNPFEFVRALAGSGLLAKINAIQEFAHDKVDSLAAQVGAPKQGPIYDLMRKNPVRRTGVEVKQEADEAVRNVRGGGG